MALVPLGRRRRRDAADRRPRGDGPGRWRAPSRVGRAMASSSASSAASTSSGSLAPPAAKSLIPLSANGLWEAEMTAAGMARSADRAATAGVGQYAQVHDVDALAGQPGRQRGLEQGARDRRVSRPTRKLNLLRAAGGRDPFLQRHAAAARPRARTSSGLSSLLAKPLTPSVPNLRVTCAVPGVFSAWSTGAPCGPS